MKGFTTRLDDALHQAASNKAEASGLSLNGYITQLIRDDLDGKGQELIITFPDDTLEPIRIRIQYV